MLYYEYIKSTISISLGYAYILTYAFKNLINGYKSFNEVIVTINDDVKLFLL